MCIFVQALDPLDSTFYSPLIFSIFFCSHYCYGLESIDYFFFCPSLILASNSLYAERVTCRERLLSGCDSSEAQVFAQVVTTV